MKNTLPQPELAFCHNASIHQRFSHTRYTSMWRHPHVPSFAMGCYFHQSSKIPFQYNLCRQNPFWRNNVKDTINGNKEAI